jgi:hypothetical protein
MILNFAQLGLVGYSQGEEALPDYDSLSNLELYVDYSGLETNTTNDYGVVDGSGNVTTLKSLSPGPTDRPFTNVGTAPTLTADGIVFGGAGTLRAGVASKTWANFLHYAADINNLQSVVHAVVKFGTGSNPDAAYGLLGNNAASSANKGFSIWFDDRSAVPRSNAFVGFVSTGTAALISTIQNEVITPNAFCVIRVETKWFSTVFFRQRIFINGQLYGTAVTSATSTPVTTPTHDLEIGATGNSALPGTLTIKELSIQSTFNTQEFYKSFTTALLNKHNITAPSVLSTVDVSNTLSIYDTYQEAVGKYYLSAGLDQHPTKKYLVLRAVLDGQDHTADPLKKITVQRSLDYGLTKGSNIDAYHPSGDIFAGDLGTGFAANGRHHMFTNTHTANGVTFDPPHKLIYLYSDDDGASYVATDLTSILPVDDLIALRTYGNVIENSNGVLLTCGYRFTNEGVFTNSERFVLKSTDGGSNWTYIAVERTADYRNEGAIIFLDDNTVLLLARDEVTKEWAQYISTDIGETWVNQGAQAFGETLTSAGPCRLTKFKIDSTDVIACYYPDRANKVVKVIYGTAAGIIANGLTGFVAGTKTTILSGTSRLAHYGDYLHPMGNFNAIMLSAYENNPQDNSNNDLITALVPSTQYATVKTALGL